MKREPSPAQGPTHLGAYLSGPHTLRSDFHASVEQVLLLQHALELDSYEKRWMMLAAAHTSARGPTDVILFQLLTVDMRLWYKHSNMRR